MALPQPFQFAQDEYRGVKGWLLFFCISLTILSPLFTVAGLARGFSAGSRVEDRLPGFMTAMASDSVLAAPIMALGIFAVVSLWAVKPNAVRVAKLYLIVQPVYAVLEVALFLAILPSSATGTVIEKGTTSVLGSLLYAGLWFSYLSKSKRVRATYSFAEGGEYADADTSEYIGLNLSARGSADRAQSTPQQSKPGDSVEPVSPAAALNGEEKTGQSSELS
jgi:hypothetical protein